jgi:hypothetical protein
LADEAKLGDVCITFLTAKRGALDWGKLSADVRGLRPHPPAAHQVFDRDRLVEDPRPADFSNRYGELVISYGLTTIGLKVIKGRTLFNFAIESNLITKGVKYGPEFVAPGTADKRKHKAKLKQVNGTKTFTADEFTACSRRLGRSSRR